jgi:REP element-mobilizing transposase RayT
MEKERYWRGCHTIMDLKYHLVWKTKCSCGVLKDDVALRLRDITQEICTEKALEMYRATSD